MRSISIPQPWAWAVVSGRKNVLNRRSSTRLGPLAIQASQTFDTAGAHYNLMRQAWALLGMQEFPKVVGPLVRTDPHLPTGVILGVVDVVNVHLVDPLRGCYVESDVLGWLPLDGSDASEFGWTPRFCSPWCDVPARGAIGAEKPLRHWTLSDPRLLVEPLPFKGHLRARRLPESIESAVRSRLPLKGARDE
jgi:hypothetical protein